MTTVHVAMGVGTNATKYHPDPECPRINSARNVQEKELSLIEGHYSECLVCTEESQAGTNHDFGYQASLREAAAGGWEP